MAGHHDLSYNSYILRDKSWSFAEIIIDAGSTSVLLFLYRAISRNGKKARKNIISTKSFPTAVDIFRLIFPFRV